MRAVVHVISVIVEAI